MILSTEIVGLRAILSYTVKKEYEDALNTDFSPLIEKH
jgi:hypothetical protein